MTFYAHTFATPCGAFSVAVDDTGAIAATAFGNLEVLAQRLRPCRLVPDSARARAVEEQVNAYFAGKKTTFSLRMDPHGTEFQHKVWTALRRIPFGETRSYGELAAAVGNPAAARAIGRANATNPICLIVPCHRVIGADGALTGFAFGETIKRQLLQHEAALASELKAPANLSPIR